MSEDSKPFHPLDPGRIHSIDPVEFQYWCTQLGCSEAELREALTEVGDHVTAVRAWLAGPR